MRHLFSVGFLTLAFVTCSLSQDFFPHAKGNKWVYRNFYSAGGHISYSIRAIGADTVMPNGKRYFYCPLFDFAYPFARVDSNGVYVYSIISKMEARVFRFDATVGDQWGASELFLNTVGLAKVDSISIFSRKVKTFDFVGLKYLTTRYTFAESFGFIEEFTPVAQLGADYVITTLQGCIIDGVTYGNLTSAEKIQSAVPERVNLFPSYPNPFNGQTTVRFSLDKREHMRLAIYDILGREVAVLIENELEAGVYNAPWSPKGVGSGVYFVRLQTSRNVLSQKIVYMK